MVDTDAGYKICGEGCGIESSLGEDPLGVIAALPIAARRPGSRARRHSSHLLGKQMGDRLKSLL
jgi:hypothetical protein